MALSGDPDSALMLRVKEKEDLAAFEELVEKYQHPVMNLIARTLQDPDEAEDLAQAVFVQAFKAAPRYRAEAKFSTWLFTIARNLCLNEIRRRSRRPSESMDSPTLEKTEPGLEKQYVDTAQQVASNELLHSELEAKIEEALRELPENQRTALLLHRNEELSYVDIAEVLGCSLSATKSLIHRARETLKARLKPYLKTGEWPKKSNSEKQL